MLISCIETTHAMMRLAFFGLLACSVSVYADEKAVRKAIDKSLPVLGKAASNYPNNRDCFSCHHQSLPVMAIQAAKQRGYEVSEFGVALQVKFTVGSFSSKLAEVSEGRGVGGANTTAAYALHTLQVADHPRDDVTEALVRFLLVRQNPEGFWSPTTQRPPTEGSKFTIAALAFEAFNAYGSTDLKEKIDTARSKARKWVEDNEPAHTEDTVFRLWALNAAKSDAKKIEAAQAALVKLQQDDGGWGQLPDMKADAYATGSALVALRKAGMATTDPVYQRGVAYLLKTQDECGAWIVQTRSKPIQALFDNGDPGGKSQFITVAATGWATLALLETLPTK
jgi:N-acyl-D-amino-acid deacylase